MCLCVVSVLTKIIKAGYAALQLEYFFTAGPDEVRAWTIRVRTGLQRAFTASGVFTSLFLLLVFPVEP